MSSRIPLLRLIAPIFLISSAHGVVEDWFMDKGITYRQSGDGNQPSAAAAWTIEVTVVTTNPGDFGSVSISRDGSAVSHSFVFVDGEWNFDADYQSEAAMNAEFPSSSTYTITASGGTLGQQVQTFTLGAANYPNIPYLVGSDYTRVQSIDAQSDFVFHWNAAGGFGNAGGLEIIERPTDIEAALFEIDAVPLPESQSLAAVTLEDGYCYEGYLSFLNSVEVSDTGGFGQFGYIEHSSNLSFEIQTVLSPAVDAIVGVWQFGNGASNASGVLVFQANGVYFHAEDVPDGDPGEFDGMERGTFTWDENSGLLSATPQVDTNGTIGLSHPNGSDVIVINGDTMSLTDNDETTVLARVAFNPAIRIEGGWRICDNGGSNTGVLVFLDNGIYFHAESDGAEQGMERGTYTWNSTTGELTASQVVDTNGTIGLSDPIGMFVANIPGPRVLNISDGDPTDLHRVTNAAVMPDWRLNKARIFNQTTDNAAPATAAFWDVFSLVETRNPTDVTSVTLSGGGLATPVTFETDGEGEWFYDKDYANEALLDAEFPDSQVYTITVSGGELGTLSQEVNIGGKDFPNAPFLTDTTFSDAQSIDPTLEFNLDWNVPVNETYVEIIVTGLPDESGTEFFFESFPGGGSSGSTLPAGALPAGFQAYGYLEFSKFLIGVDGAGGFGSSGFSSRQSITMDFPINAKSSAELVSGAAEDAGLSGPDAAPDAIPFDDGVPNILKYAFNMDLSGPDLSNLESGSGSSGLPVFGVGNPASASSQSLIGKADLSLSSEFKVEFIRRKGSGLIYTPKVSSTLLPGSFAEMTGTETVSPIGTDGKFERVVVRQPYDPSVAPKAFGIVEVSGM
jgi:hypothetical protein